MFALLPLLAACGPADRVVWDDPAATTDAVADVTVALFTLGVAHDDDRALLDAFHAAGTSLELRVVDRSGGSVAGWTVDSLDPDICQVVTDTGDQLSDALPVTVYFRRAGSTDLFVKDASGAVLDWQPVEIRDPAEAEVFAYEALAVDVRAPLDAVHVLPGAAATLAAAWVSGEGNPLSGTGLLDATTADEGLSVAPSDALAAQSFEAFDLVISEDAPLGEATVALSSDGELVRDLPVHVHDPADVTGVRLDVAVDGGEDGASGNVRAVVLTDAAELVGVPVTWRDDGVEVGSGSWVVVQGDPGESRTLEACYGEVCDAVDVPGHVVSIGSPVADEVPGSCGCATGGGGAGAAAGLLAALLVFRRRRP